MLLIHTKYLPGLDLSGQSFSRVALSIIGGSRGGAARDPMYVLCSRRAGSSSISRTLIKNEFAYRVLEMRDEHLRNWTFEDHLLARATGVDFIICSASTVAEIDSLHETLGVCPGSIAVLQPNYAVYMRNVRVIPTITFESASRAITGLQAVTARLEQLAEERSYRIVRVDEETTSAQICDRLIELRM